MSQVSEEPKRKFFYSLGTSNYCYKYCVKQGTKYGLLFFATFGAGVWGARKAGMLRWMTPAIALSVPIMAGMFGFMLNAHHAMYDCIYAEGVSRMNQHNENIRAQKGRPQHKAQE
eukprot:TRINITY_DN2832_c0_g1_i1.p1 TRINITY_DN2832_c0_g1~~TRINITY_DN2832_c0_g1_i1.p1  ORF type:complete len:124 (+),score=21.34 TRINITY_DN2832_c0_g1_i1:28-372(+)